MALTGQNNSQRDEYYMDHNIISPCTPQGGVADLGFVEGGLCYTFVCEAHVKF
jgi:hypothetical protein